MLKNVILSILVSAPSALAFVSGPSEVRGTENALVVGLQTERGKVEPNENRDSFQDAQIDIYKFKYVRGLDKVGRLERTNLFVEYGTFSSAIEQVGDRIFYDGDKGSYLTLGVSTDLIHSLDKKFGVYVQASPLRSYNRRKFSNPRLDVFALGLTSAFSITEALFQRNLIHFGSGDGKDQNSYLAIDTGFGYLLNHLLGHPVTILGGLFLEADTSEREDALYDGAFSGAGRTDRIRAFKYGLVVGADVSLFSDLSLNASSLQKLGGYDARSTQIFVLNLGYRF